jgi:Acetyltransferase (GNAT) domain
MNSFPTITDTVDHSEKMETFEFNPLKDPRWNAFIAQHPHASVSHRGEWLQALQRTYGCEPVAVSTCGPDSYLTNAIVFCRVRSRLTGNRLVSLPFSDHCEPLYNELAQTDALVATLIESISKHNWKYFEFRPPYYVPIPQTPLGICKTYFLHYVDLQRSEDALLKSFHKNCIQRKIMRAERESLRCAEGHSQVLLQQFYKLMITTRRRLGLPPQPLKWFQNLALSFGEDLKIRVAYKGELPIASILTIRTNRTMVYKYGCSDARFNNLGGMVLLLWNAMREARRNGLMEFDMGRSDVAQEGLITFKEHWGAQRLTLNYWRYPPAIRPKAVGTAMNFLRHIAMRAPEKLLVIIGNLLYKHIA